VSEADEVEIRYFLTDASERSEVVFGRRLRELRIGVGWSQAEVASRLRARDRPMHQTAIAKIEAGTRPLRLDEAWDIAEVFNVPLMEFFYASAEDLLAEGIDPHARISQLEDLLEATTEEIEMARLEEKAGLKKLSMFRAELEAARRLLAQREASADGGEDG